MDLASGLCNGRCRRRSTLKYLSASAETSRSDCYHPRGMRAAWPLSCVPVCAILITQEDLLEIATYQPVNHARCVYLTSASPLVSVSAVVSALQLLPMSSKKKFGQIILTRETVATDPCTLEGPSPGGGGGDTVGT